MHPFDDLDKNLLTALSKDSSESIPLLAKKLGTKQSVLYGRIKRLRSAGVIEKFTIIVNDKVLGIGVKATVGISRNPQVKAEIHHALELASEVDEISEVTGRFDMLVRIRAKNLEDFQTARTNIKRILVKTTMGPVIKQVIQARKKGSK